MATARFMETWAHALDVYDAARQRSERPEPTDRIRHVAHLGVRTRDYAFSVQERGAAGRGVPRRADRAVAVRPGPGGRRTPRRRVTGSAYDFCLLVTQRVHRDDTDLVAIGADAEHWLTIAQAFAGPAGEGRRGRADRAAPDRQLLRLLRRPAVRDARACSRAAALDVLTGDYLAELTMLILGKDTMKDPSLGYARTFVRQLEDCLGLALEQGVRIVSNAGGLNPAGLADRIREVAKGLGLDPAVAHVEGDDLRALGAGFDGALTANAYLGGFGIAAALTAGADVVVTGRVTDASPRGRAGGRAPRLDADVVRRAGRRRRRRPRHRVRRPGDRRQLLRVPRAGPDGMDPAQPLGFPVAEVAADGSSVITKHDGTGGAVTVDTVTAQLRLRDPVDALPQPRRHRRPRLDPARARTAPTGSPSPASAATAPPERLKVCVNELGGFRNQVEFVLTGLDIEEKAEWVREPARARR